MKRKESTRSWEHMGGKWIRLAQTSEHQTQFLMPYMLDKLQDVKDKNILDLGCGLSRHRLAAKGASVSVLDAGEAPTLSGFLLTIL